MKHWQRTAGLLHAVDSPETIHFGGAFRALCGATAIPTDSDPNLRPPPICCDCESVWRAIEDTPQFEDAV
jgi:hypothetical protein